MESVLGLTWNVGNVEPSASHEILFMETSEFSCLLYFPPGFQWGDTATMGGDRTSSSHHTHTRPILMDIINIFLWIKYFALLSLWEKLISQFLTCQLVWIYKTKHSVPGWAVLALEIIEMLEDKQQSWGLAWDIFVTLMNLAPLGICIFNLT